MALSNKKRKKKIFENDRTEIKRTERKRAEQKRSEQKRPPVWPYILTAVIVLTLVVTALVIYKKCKITTIYVDGNVHYSDEEIAEMVMNGALGNNSIYLFLKYRDREIKDVPFVETMSVNIEASDTIRITVYEKKLAGYVEYLDRYLYFDRAGTIVESAQILTDGIPLVTGFSFDHAVLYEPLPIEDDSLFEKVLDITQLLNKYSLDVDRIHFTPAGEIILYFKDIEVDIGSDDFIDEKIMVLPDILSKLEGKKGVMNLTDYQSGDTITFEKYD